MKTYSIFQVYDYKGGELDFNVNLPKEKFISYLGEIISISLSKSEIRDYKINVIIDEDKKILKSIVKEKISEWINCDDNMSLYAGGEGFCGSLFENDNSTLREVQFEDFIDDIADFYINGPMKQI